MSVRVVARIRPLLKNEIEKDVIVNAARGAGDTEERECVVQIPNPKNARESYAFHFNSVYEAVATQQQLYDNEVAPTVKHLFKGCDVTLFAYGVTGTGKTHTMRGGKALAERGVIPRLLSAIYRRARKIEKDTEGATQVGVVMSYYEIYNDRVFDLFEPPDKRTAAGLPIRDVGTGKTQVVGLTERPCTTLKEFEQAYDQANVNRSTSATKLNAHSSRSHAILCVKVIQTTGEETRVSTASAIDLAGSEDNRRTDNNKDRLVESASINKSLFVLAQCVEAISKKQPRIPYRESKMTRILSLGQNNGYTVMILNLAPVRSYHLDTLSSLNFANRTKKIEVNEIENQPFFREQPPTGKLDGEKSSALNAPSMNRQPLRPKLLSQDSHLKEVANVAKPAKSFAVYSDKSKSAVPTSHAANTAVARSSNIPLKSPKRTSSEAVPTLGRPSKFPRPDPAPKLGEQVLSNDAIEALIERKVTEALAERADRTTVSEADQISEEVQKRLDALEKRVEGQETERAEGLQYLLMAKQHQVRGEDVSAMKMYQLALPHFPGNEKLLRKMSALQERIAATKAQKQSAAAGQGGVAVNAVAREEERAATRRRKVADEEDESYHEARDGAAGDDYEEDGHFKYRPRTKIRRPQLQPAHRSLTAPAHPTPPAATDDDDDSEDELASALTAQTPRTKQLLKIINTKDVSQIQMLKGIGAKKAAMIVDAICDLDDDARIESLGQLGKLRGVGVKTVEGMRVGLGGLVL
ncbi:kinesin-domain-containing protein [Teratosphaeria nubilosa]|uniref:Kinesin-domain-containing protein n=1 Tax=Teratosphaeria nubilosa TaxID=161662 RepID=A0A6G1LM73_9PEZI|nr:kinesin-domain-containing protein [Teratosphaeria nubilosa]